MRGKQTVTTNIRCYFYTNCSIRCKTSHLKITYKYTQTYLLHRLHRVFWKIIVDVTIWLSTFWLSNTMCFLSLKCVSFQSFNLHNMRKNQIYRMLCREAKQSKARKKTDTHKHWEKERWSNSKENDLYGRMEKKYWISFICFRIKCGKQFKSNNF